MAATCPLEQPKAMKNHFCSRLDLRIYSRDVGASAIIDAMGLTALTVHERGRRRRTLRGQELSGNYATTYVSFRLCESCETTIASSIENNIQLVCERMRILTEGRIRRARVVLYAGWFANGSRHAEVFQHRLLKRLGENHVTLE